MHCYDKDQQIAEDVVIKTSSQHQRYHMIVLFFFMCYHKGTKSYVGVYVNILVSLAANLLLNHSDN